MPVATPRVTEGCDRGEHAGPQTGRVPFPYGKGTRHLVSLPAAGSLKPVFRVVRSKEKIKC